MFYRNKAINTALTTLLLANFSSLAWAQDYIAPPMVSIPAGTFMMGAEGGDPAILPIHSVSVNAFLMSKYTVTVAEFKKFAEETGFKRDSTCNDFIDKEGLRGPTHQGSGRWDSHRYTYSEYQPVVCISRQDANAYAAWLGEKSGRHYRLPTEIEWEYAAKASTTTKYFWGDDPLQTQACKYGNFADYTGEHTNNKLYGLSNIGFVGTVNCDDGEAYNAIVGLYRPNPFGLYDMSGNVAEFLNTCYTPNGYETKTSLTDESCEFTVHRGGNWHYPASPTSTRGRIKKSGWNVDAGIGFRLVIEGSKPVLDATTAGFEKQLAQAQSKRLTEREALLPAPKASFLIDLGNGSYSLNWQPVKDKRVTGYAIYQSNSPQSHFYGGYYQKHYQKIKSVPAEQYTTTVNLPKEGGSYRVVALSSNTMSLPGPKAVVGGSKTTVSLPGRIDLRHATQLENVPMYYFPATDTRPAAYNIFKTNKNFDQTEVNITFNTKIANTGWYQLNYSGRTFQQGEFFKLWQGNRLAGSIGFDAKVDDKSSTRHKVYLEAGEHELQITVLRDKFDRWGLGWLNLTETTAPELNN